jgi:hypothetical protein
LADRLTHMKNFKHRYVGTSGSRQLNPAIGHFFYIHAIVLIEIYIFRLFSLILEGCGGICKFLVAPTDQHKFNPFNYSNIIVQVLNIDIVIVFLVETIVFIVELDDRCDSIEILPTPVQARKNQFRIDSKVICNILNINNNNLLFLFEKTLFSCVFDLRR